MGKINEYWNQFWKWTDRQWMVIKKWKYWEAFLVVFLVIILILTIFYFNTISSYLFSSEDRNGELAKVILTMLGGIGVIYGLVLNSKRIKEQTRQNDITKINNVDNRFSEAIKHMESKEPAIVLGGIYTLFQLAKADSRYPYIVYDIFTNYLRNDSQKYLDIVDTGSIIMKEEFNSNIDSQEASYAVIKIIDLLISNDDLFDKKTYQKILFRKMLFNDLTGFNFSLSYFYNCHFTGNLEKVNFKHCWFINCVFGTLDTKIINCDFSNANFKGCNFVCEILENSKFIFTNCNEFILQARIVKDCFFEIMDGVVLCSEVVENTDLNDKVLRQKWD